MVYQSSQQVNPEFAIPTGISWSKHAMGFEGHDLLRAPRNLLLSESR